MTRQDMARRKLAIALYTSLYYYLNSLYYLYATLLSRHCRTVSCRVVLNDFASSLRLEQ